MRTVCLGVISQLGEFTLFAFAAVVLAAGLLGLR
jgi:hypothetical protein